MYWCRPGACSPFLSTAIRKKNTKKYSKFLLIEIQLEKMSVGDESEISSGEILSFYFRNEKTISTEGFFLFWKVILSSKNEFDFANNKFDEIVPNQLICYSLVVYFGVDCTNYIMYIIVWVYLIRIYTWWLIG